MSATWSRGVVVGFDGSADSLQALRWALGAAERHDAPLTVASAYAVPFGMPDPDAESRDVREAVLDRAHQAVRAMRPPASTEVGFRAHPGSAAHLLVTCSRTADLVVVGRGACRGALGSVAVPTAAMSYGPVAVVPLGARTGPPGRVVACVDPDHDPAAVLDFAFDEARAAGQPVLIVCAVEPVRSSAVLDAELTGSTGLGPLTGDELAELLELWSTKYTDVERTITVRRGPADTALLDGVTDGDLVVLGGRRHPRAVGRLLGSVSDAVLRHTPGTAVVVHSRNER